MNPNQPVEVKKPFFTSRRQLFLILSVFFLAIALPVTVLVSQQRQIIENKAANSDPAPTPFGYCIPSSPVPPSPSSNSKVYFLGDSIGAGSESNIKSSLTNNGWNATINSVSSRRLVGSVPLGGTGVAEADKDIIKNMGVIIVELGTNDCTASSDSFKDKLNTLYTKLTSINNTAKYYWVDYAFKNGSLACASYHMPLRNQDLRNFIANGNKAITIIPWSSVGVQYLDSSGVHPTSAGRAALAKVIADTLGSYSSQ